MAGVGWGGVWHGDHARNEELGFTLSPGTLYSTLHALLKEGDVTVSNRKVQGKIRKCYRATAKGRKELAEVRERLAVLMRKIF